MFGTCKAVRAEKKALEKELEAERRKYADLERDFERRVEGRVRAVHAELCAERSLCEEALKEKGRALSKRNEYHAELKRVAAERRELASDKAKLSLEIKELRSDRAAELKGVAAGARADERRHQRELAAVQALATEQVDEASRSLLDAAARIRAAEARAKEMEQLAADAVEKS